MPKNNFTGMLGSTQKLKAIKDREDTKNSKDTQDTLDTENSTDTLKPYRLNLKLSGDLKQYLSDEAWRERISITQLVNKALEEYKTQHPAPEEG